MPQSSTKAFLGIFVSYRRDDSSGHAGRLFDRLVAHFGRERIFMDIDTIEPGEDFVTVIENAVGSCDILIAVIGRNWISGTVGGTGRLDNPNDFVRVEIATALRRDIRVIPVLVQQASMPKRQDLPDDLAKFTRRNAIELSENRWHSDVDQLIGVMERVLAKRAETARGSQSGWAARIAEASRQTEAEGQRREEEEGRHIQEENQPHLAEEEPKQLAREERQQEGGEIERSKAGEGLTTEVLASWSDSWGVRSYEEKNYAQAEAHFRATLRIIPNNADYHNNLGNALFFQQKYAEAESSYREAVRLSPNKAVFHCNLGRALSDLRKYPEAEVEFREAIRLDPNDATYQEELRQISNVMHFLAQNRER